MSRDDLASWCGVGIRLDGSATGLITEISKDSELYPLYQHGDRILQYRDPNHDFTGWLPVTMQGAPYSEGKRFARIRGSVDTPVELRIQRATGEEYTVQIMRAPFGDVPMADGLTRIEDLGSTEQCPRFVSELPAHGLPHGLARGGGRTRV